VNCEFEVVEKKDGSYWYNCLQCGLRLHTPSFQSFMHSNCSMAGNGDAEDTRDALAAWLRHHGVSQSRHDEIEKKFGIPSRICAERRVWEVSVMRYLMKTRRRNNGRYPR